MIFFPFSTAVILCAMAVWISCAGLARADTIRFYRDENGGMHFVKERSSDNSSIVLKPPMYGGVTPSAWRGGLFLPFFGVMSAGADREEVLALARQYGREFGVDDKLICAVIEVESGYRVDVVSDKGAQGLMQIMPETGKDLGLKQPFDPEDNIRAGVRYLKEQLDRFKSVELALAAYNAGPQQVERYGGVPPFEETQNYVRKVMLLLE